MTTNRQNENRVGKVIHQSVGVKIAQTSLLPAIENLEKEQIQIQDWIKTLFTWTVCTDFGPWISNFISKIQK